ncbi:MAG: hypothetical protein ACUVQG_15165 [Thermogutta sp.]
MQYRTAQVTIYTILLAIALVAIIVGCVFLFLEVQDYGSPPYPEGGIVRVLTPAFQQVLAIPATDHVFA